MSTNPAECGGFFENFDANQPLIEARLIRVMLGALPAEHARRFLDDLRKGDMLGAALNAFRAVMKAAGGLHVGVARWRSGLEVVAGAMKECSGEKVGDKVIDKFNPGNFYNVLEASACLGITQDKLIQPNPRDQRDWLSVSVKPMAFHMILRAVASACVALPYGGTKEEVDKSREQRAESCNEIGFKPTERPYRIKLKETDKPESGGEGGNTTDAVLTNTVDPGEDGD